MSPAATACEAKWAACWLEPHMRLRLTAGTVTGKPASITPSRPIFAPCSPAWVTVPFMTSSTFSGSSPARSRSPSRVCARRASGRTSRKAPPAFPNGVRTASRITGSLIEVMIRLLLSYGLWCGTPGSQARRQAAVHRYHGSGHVRCRPGGQVERHAGHVPLAADPAHGCPLGDLLSLGLEGGRHHARLEGPRGDRVDGDPR